jgi:GH24 family phage-related lysozyme (muramidase)
VRFSVRFPDGQSRTVAAAGCTAQTTDGVATKVWKGTAVLPSAGLYSFTAFSSEGGAFSGTGFSSDVLVATQAGGSVTTAEQRRASDKMLNLIARWEGYSAAVYDDELASSRIPTVGYGCTYGANAVFYNNLSQTEAWSLLVNRINRSSYTSELNRMIANNRFRMSQNQADCLLSFAYNVGSGYFNGAQEMDFRRIMKNAVVPPAIPAGSSVRATVTMNAALHGDRSNSSAGLEDVSSGTPVDVTGSDFSDTKNGWYQVRLPDGKTGWLNSGYVSLADSDSLVHDLNYTNAYAFGTELIRWNQAGGRFYAGLFYRRLGEANVYNYGDYDAVRYNKYGYAYPPSASSLS